MDGLESGIAGRAARCGIPLAEEAVAMLAEHARAVRDSAEEFGLTSIRDPEAFLERHLGEAFEGAALLDPAVEGVLLDLGSGNGYPGLPLAVARPGLQLLFCEASPRRAGFLREVLERIGLERAEVLEAQIQRASDLFDLEPIRVLSTRAMGGWEKILPRLAARMDDLGEMLVWAGAEMEPIARRAIWRKRLRLVERKPLPGRERSWIWRFAVG